MNYTTKHFLFFALLSLITTITSSCQSDADVSTYTKKNCRLTSRTITSGTNGQIISNWQYDANGRLIQYTSPSAISPYPSQVDLRYDSEGYLISMTQRIVYSGFAGFFTDTTVTTYSYANGRLIREEGARGSLTYEYDASGELTKVTNSNGSYSDTTIDVYSSGKFIDHIIVKYDSKAEMHPYQIVDGHIIRENTRDPRSYVGYQYDSEGRCTKIETVANDTIRQYFTYSYTTGQAYFDAIPLPKGWPTVARKAFIYDELFWNRPITPTGLIASWTRYTDSKPGSSELFKNIVREYTHSKNGQGYPIKSDYTTTVYTHTGTVVGTPSYVTETYTYEGCP
ncbi:hypothetical protein [Spirosoma gilvum]